MVSTFMISNSNFLRSSLLWQEWAAFSGLYGVSFTCLIMEKQEADCDMSLSEQAFCCALCYSSNALTPGSSIPRVTQTQDKAPGGQLVTQLYASLSSGSNTLVSVPLKTTDRILSEDTRDEVG